MFGSLQYEESLAKRELRMLSLLPEAFQSKSKQFPLRSRSIRWETPDPKTSQKRTRKRIVLLFGVEKVKQTEHSFPVSFLAHFCCFPGDDAAQVISMMS